MALRIAFVGLPLAALLLHHDGHEIVYAGICRKAAPGTRRLARVLGDERVFVKPALGGHAAMVRSRKPDLLVSWFWTSRIPKVFRTVGALGSFGVHPSLLPRHRGGDPYFAVIDGGEGVTGVTAHVLEEEYDTGDLLASRELAVDPAWTAWTLAKKLDRPSLAVLREVTRAYAEGRPPARVTQDESLATAAPVLREEDLALDFSWSAERLSRRVRAASPYPGAYFFLGDEVLTVTAARATKVAPDGLAPGEVAVDREGTAVVCTAEGGLALYAARLAGEEDEETLLDRAAIAELVRGMVMPAV